MRTAPLIWTIVLLVLIGIGIYFLVSPGSPGTSITATPTGSTATSTETSQMSSNMTLTTPWGITLTYDADNYGLATTAAQVMIKSYIPSCDSPLNYCFYYTGTQYQGTNFESAGLRITKRTSLTTQNSCLTTPPTGYSISATATSSTPEYATSVFANVGGAAAGHFANGSIYRLYIPSAKSCTEFETRVGQSDYNNYPAGTIKEFTSADQSNVLVGLNGILGSVMIASSSEQVQFPTP